MKIKLDSYNQALVDLCEAENFKDRLNEVKVFTKPMRTGKNFSECDFRIPYLFKKFIIIFLFLIIVYSFFFLILLFLQFFEAYMVQINV